MRTVNTLTFGTALALLASMLAAGEAEAKSHISVGIAIGAPIYAAPYDPAPPVYYAPPPPAYYAPHPIYWRHGGDEDDD